MVVQPKKKTLDSFENDNSFLFPWSHHRSTVLVVPIITHLTHAEILIPIGFSLKFVSSTFTTDNKYTSTTVINVVKIQKLYISRTLRYLHTDMILSTLDINASDNDHLHMFKII